MCFSLWKISLKRFLTVCFLRILYNRLHRTFFEKCPFWSCWKNYCLCSCHDFICSCLKRKTIASTSCEIISPVLLKDTKAHIEKNEAAQRTKVIIFLQECFSFTVRNSITPFQSDIIFYVWKLTDNFFLQISLSLFSDWYYKTINYIFCGKNVPFGDLKINFYEFRHFL